MGFGDADRWPWPDFGRFLVVNKLRSKGESGFGRLHVVFLRWRKFLLKLRREVEVLGGGIFLRFLLNQNLTEVNHFSTIGETGVYISQIWLQIDFYSKWDSDFYERTCSFFQNGGTWIPISMDFEQIIRISNIKVSSQIFKHKISNVMHLMQIFTILFSYFIGYKERSLLVQKDLMNKGTRNLENKYGIRKEFPDYGQTGSYREEYREKMEGDTILIRCNSELSQLASTKTQRRDFTGSSSRTRDMGNREVLKFDNGSVFGFKKNLIRGNHGFENLLPKKNIEIIHNNVQENSNYFKKAIIAEIIQRNLWESFIVIDKNIVGILIILPIMVSYRIGRKISMKITQSLAVWLLMVKLEDNFGDQIWKKYQKRITATIEKIKKLKADFRRESILRTTELPLYNSLSRSSSPHTSNTSFHFSFLKISPAINNFSTMTQGRMVSQSSLTKSQKGEMSKPTIKIPHFDNSSLIKGYGKTLIGRCMNPAAQDMNTMLYMMPKIWGMEGRIAVGDLGMGRLQMDFDSEEDISKVLAAEPFHFDNWMISLVRWEPVVDEHYPSVLTFWVRVMGVPLQFWAEQTFMSIGGALGVVKEVDLDIGRVRVMVDGLKPLLFDSLVEFQNRQEIKITLRYERLFGFCRTCHSLCHDHFRCPSRIRAVDTSSDIPRDHDRHSQDHDRHSRDHDNSFGGAGRSFSYKGAITHGSSSSSRHNRGSHGDYSRNNKERRVDTDAKEKTGRLRENSRDLRSVRVSKRTSTGTTQPRNSRLGLSRNFVWKRSLQKLPIKR